MNGEAFHPRLASCLELPGDSTTDALRLQLNAAEYPVGDLCKLTETSLWSIATRAAGLARGFPCLATIKDSHGRYVFVNDTWERVFRKSPADWYLKSDSQLWDASLADSFSRPESEVRTNLATAHQEICLSTSGTVTYWLMASFPLELSPGEIYIGSVAVDITERKVAEAALRESEDRIRDLFNSVLTGIYRTTPTGEILLANPAMACMLGYDSVEQLMEASAADLYLDNSGREQFIEQMSKTGQVQGLEVTLRRRDGSIMQARETVKTAYAPDGSIAYFEGVVEDVTGLRRAEALEHHRNTILELIARNESLDVIFGSICRLVESQHPDVFCRIRIAGSDPAADFDEEKFASRQSTPILSANQDVLGTITVYHRTGTDPDPKQLELVGNLTHLAALALEHHQLYDSLEYQASHDLLTGLPNRVLFADRLDTALTKARQKAHRAAILWIDLDRFKEINDALGHRIGDLLIASVSQMLQSLARPGETLARMGGDEFALLLPEIRDRAAAKERAQAIVSSLRSPFQIEHYELFVTCSIGICVYPEDGLDGATLQRNADGAMYQAKASGRNLYVDYEPKIGADAIHRREMESYLRHAADHGELELFYQPQADLSGRVRAVEALIRWNHPRRGLLGPGEFINLAEESGLIQPIGKWIVEEACRAKARWSRNGFPNVRVAINISPLQIYYGDLPDVIRAALQQTGVEPSGLELELTETVMLRNFDESIRQMERLRSIGVTLAMDDFGTGYSSLSYLQRLPIDLLKLDRSFVSQIEFMRSRAVVTAILALAHTLGLKVVAEGVERRSQLELVRAAGVDLIQGYLVSRPLPESAIVNLFDATCLF